MANSILVSLKSIFAITDEQAMWRVQMEDDAQAFAHLMRRWEKPLQNLCLRMIGDSHRSEDLVQEAFARVYARRKDYKPISRFSTYIWRITINLCHDELRRGQRRREEPLDDREHASALEELPSSAPDPTDVTSQRERADRVREALLRLPENYRAVLVLRHYEDLKFREIAEVLELPEGTVKSRMAEALTLIAEILRPALADEKSPMPIPAERHAPEKNLRQESALLKQKECAL